MESGLAPQLRVAFARETGVAIHLMPDPATEALAALDRGERDVALSNAPSIEASLAEQGLVHDRRLVARTRMVLVGPSAWKKELDAGQDIQLALSRVVNKGWPFLSAGNGSGAHLAEQALWRKAVTAPKGNQAIKASATAGVLAQAAQLQAVTLVEHGLWLQAKSRKNPGIGSLAVLCENDPLMALPVHVMRGFRASHPTARLWVNWLSGPRARAVILSSPGYEPAT
jgi:tungstate transport system substrate-binding protein